MAMAMAISTRREAQRLDPIAMALDSVPSRRQRLERAFNELEAWRVALASCTIEWKQLEDHLIEVERCVQKRYDELVSRERALEARVRETQEALSKRDEAIAAREEASLARVQEQRELAIASIADEKRRWNEERQALEELACGKQQFIIENVGMNESPPGEEVSDHEQLDNNMNKSSEDSEESLGNKTQIQQQQQELDGGSSCKDATTSPAEAASGAAAALAAAAKTLSTSTTTPTTTTTTNTSAVAEVRVRPELKSHCEDMDGEGLRKYVIEHRKDVSALRVELPIAIQCAIDPASLVLDALEGYHLPEHGSGSGISSCSGDGSGNGVGGTGTIGSGCTGGDTRKDSGASANRRACVLILESVVSALADPVMGADHPVVPPNIKERAKELADKWRSKMDILKDAPASENSLDAQAFLQLLATYGIASEYDDEELCKLVTAVARRRQSPALCRALGLSYKIPDIVDSLAREGKQIEALAFAHAFDIMDRVQPVPMLKAYLKDSRKTAQLILKNGNNSAAAQNDSSMKELSALKSVLKCIEEYKLEAQFPPQTLQKRIDVLEKAKADRKRAAVAVKAQSKRPRASNPSVVGGAPDRNFYRSCDRTPQYGGVNLPTYGMQTAGYDRRAPGGYATTYAGNRTPVSMSASYLYSPDGLASSLYGSPAYANPSYSSYQFGSGLPPPPPAYQASFLH